MAYELRKVRKAEACFSTTRDKGERAGEAHS
jgi:hypothetical protein